MPKISLDMPSEIVSDMKKHVGDSKKFVSLAAIYSFLFLGSPVWCLHYQLALLTKQEKEVVNIT